MNTLEMISLAKLRLSEANVRKNDSNLFIEELAANIEAKGLLQNLIVVPAKKRGNDPHGERDFGAVEHEGHKIFWKIDVYANDGTFSWGSEAPWDARQSFRVVTIMLASDW